MKPGPVVAMVALIAVGVWLVLVPALHAGRRVDSDADRYLVVLGAERLAVERRGGDDGRVEYHFVGSDRLEALGWVDREAYDRAIEGRLEAWRSRPAWERTLLRFLNISSWVNVVWVAVGLGGQLAFFGRMMVQWLVSEKSRESVVPEVFWWLSFLGGVCLFTYFVWRQDIVGVLGQSTGIVIYARNLRLIAKGKRRAARAARAAGDELVPDGGLEPGGGSRET